MSSALYTIRLDEDLRKSLQREAAIQCRPPAELAVRAIRSMLEGIAGKRAAVDIHLEEVHQRKFISAEAMNAWIESWGTDNELPAPKANTKCDGT